MFSYAAIATARSGRRIDVWERLSDAGRGESAPGSAKRGDAAWTYGVLYDLRGMT
jgi:hypothetical protein